MTVQIAPNRRRMRRFATPTIYAVACLVTTICVLPYLGVVVSAVTGSGQTLSHLIDTVLARYTLTTLLLLAIVMTCSAAMGTGAAWLVTMTQFKGRRWFEIGLALPLAFPAYVLAYAYTHVLDHPGVVQSSLRGVTGWGARDYWFPEIRSLGGAAAMLTLVLYPYVYLLARAAFTAQGGTTFLAARVLGKPPFAAFLTVSLPMARPAIASGVMLVAMETIADFGTVAYFGVQTFAVGIYTSWFAMADRAAAAQLALGLLAFALLLAFLERASRGQAAYTDGRKRQQMQRIRLTGTQQALAIFFCTVPVLLGVVVPVVTLSTMAMGSGQDLLSPRYLGFIRNSVTLAGIAAVITVLAAVILGTLHRVGPTRWTATSLYMGRIGYAVPGGVIAVGLLVPFALFDNTLDAWMRATFDVSTGLLFTGSIWLLIMAYMIRFLAAAIGAYDGGIASVGPNMDAAARTLGQDMPGMVRRVHMPMLRTSLLTAGLIVFVDVMKELPATLIMRPFNYDTLAVQAHRLASDERLNGAAVPSLVIAAIGLIPVIVLCRRIGREGR